MRIVKPIVVVMLMLAWGPAPAEVVAVVSAKSAVTALTRNQLADIFLGKTGRFPNGAAAVPIDQPDGSPVRNEFYATYAGKSPAQIKAHWSKIIFTGRGQPPREAADDNALRKLLLADPSAIGYLDRSLVGSDLRVLAISP